MCMLFEKSNTLHGGTFYFQTKHSYDLIKLKNTNIYFDAAE